MSAIAGLATRDDSPMIARTCAQMLAAQQIYGPDGSTVRSGGGGAALGRALALCVPQDKLDAQPISIGDGRYTLVADCRIDNRDELADMLDLRSHAERMSDAAFVAAAFERWEAKSFDRLRGDFAVAVWDDRERNWILVRDVFGNAPLFFHQSAELTAIASMPQGLNALAALPGRPDTDFIAQTLRTLSMHGAGSHWQGIQRVMPGHLAILGFDGVTQRPFWTAPTGTLKLRDRREYAEGLRERIEHAVSKRLRGETRIATHLSAGLDSSTITGAAASLLREQGVVTAFTSAPRAGYDAGRVGFLADEQALAAATAALHANVEHVVVRTRDVPLGALVDRQFQLAQQPAANICNLGWMHAIADAVQARGLRVLMPAQFGNLALSYDGVHRLSDPLARSQWGRALAALLTGASGGAGALRAMLGLARRAWLVRLAPGGEDAGAEHRVPIYNESVRHLLARVDHGPNRKALYAGWRIDERDPSADRDLFDFVARLPLSVFHESGMSRALIRRAARGWVAPEVLAERRRGYQAADWHEVVSAQRTWLAEQVDAMSGDGAVAGLIDTQQLSGLIADWPERGWHEPEVRDRYRFELLRSISVGHFMRRASGANR